MLQHSFDGAVIFLSLHHFILPHLNYCPGCNTEHARAAITAVTSRREKINDAAKKEKLHFFQIGNYNLQLGTLIYITNHIVRLYNSALYESLRSLCPITVNRSAIKLTLHTSCCFVQTYSVLYVLLDIFWRNTFLSVIIGPNLT